MSPQHAMGTAFELHRPGVLDHLRLSSGCSFCGQDAIGVAVQNERRYGVAMSTALRTRFVPYLPIYRVTSPVPIEKPTRETSVRSSVPSKALRSAANVS